MTDQEAFWKTVKADPCDHLARIAFGDWLDEHAEPELAFAMRWSGFRRKYPEVTHARKWAKWKRGRIDKDGSDNDDGEPVLIFRPASGITQMGTAMNVLPIPVYDLIPKSKKGRVPNGGYLNVETAFEMLAVALRRLRAAIDFQA